MKLIDLPKFVAFEDYERLKEKLVNHISQFPQVLSIYQLGSVSNPGISDLDILVVFKNNTSCKENLIPSLSNNEKYILTHDFFGITENELYEISKFNFYTNFKLLFGKDLELNTLKINESISKQVGLEFLIMFYISLSIQLHFSTVKLRAFLLEVKALQFDLEFLKIKDSELNYLINDVLNIRNRYFISNFNEKDLKNLIKKVYLETEKILNLILKKNKFFAPKLSFYISKNIKIVDSKEFQFKYSGIVISSVFSFLNRYYFKINNRLSKFDFLLPISNSKDNQLINERFLLLEKIQKTNIKNFPNFIPITTKFNFFK